MASKTQRLANFGVGLKFSDIPPEVIHQAERVILDTVGCAVAGYILDNAKTFLHVMEAQGGKPEATLFPTGHKTSVPVAAFVNSSLAHVLDLDDNLLYHCHFANTAVLPAIAMAERQGASGKDLVTAVVAAYEVTARISLSHATNCKILSPPPNARFGSPELQADNYNVFGAAVGMGKLLGLSTEQMQDAMGMAGAHAPLPGPWGKGSTSTTMAEPTMKGTKYGWQAWTGAIAVLLAEQGITGRRDILDGEKGFWKLSGTESCDYTMLDKDLGSQWWIMETSFKMYPAGTWMRPGMTATDNIIETHAIRPEEIERIVIRGARGLEAFVKNPWAEGNPVNEIVGQTNYNYLIAMRALGIAPGKWHTAETYADPRVVDMLRKMKFVSDPANEQALYEELIHQEKTRGVRFSTKAPTTVEIHARGAVFREHADYAKGDPFTQETRASDEDLADKFRTHAKGQIPDSHLEQAVYTLLHLSSVKDVRTATPLLTV